MNIFLLSSSFIENTLISSLDYIIDRNITKITLLRENHSINEFIDYNKADIRLCDTLLEAVDMCDAAIIIVPANSRSDKYKKIYEFIKTKLDNVSFIDLNDFQDINKPFKVDSDIDETPTILIIALGHYHQVLNLEITLNEAFVENNIKIMQVFSNDGNAVLKGIESTGMLNKRIKNSVYTPNIDIRIITYCFESYELLFNNLPLLETIHKLSPCYTFLACEHNMKDSVEKIDILQNRLNRKFDSVLFSNYESIVWDNIPTPILITPNYASPVENEDKISLWNTITKKITFPDEVTIIKTSR